VLWIELLGSRRGGSRRSRLRSGLHATYQLGATRVIVFLKQSGNASERGESVRFLPLSRNMNASTATADGSGRHDT
jgi:hypothetical protein